jgi:hypothetical protein
MPPITHADARQRRPPWGLLAKNRERTNPGASLLSWPTSADTGSRHAAPSSPVSPLDAIRPTPPDLPPSRMSFTPKPASARSRLWLPFMSQYQLLPTSTPAHSRSNSIDASYVSSGSRKRVILKALGSAFACSMAVLGIYLLYDSSRSDKRSSTDLPAYYYTQDVGDVVSLT